MKEKTMKNGLKAGIISLLIMFFIYQASSLLSYGLYGHNIEPNMLVGLLSSKGVLPIIMLIIFLFIAVMHIPIIFFIGKESVLIIFDEVTRRSYSKGNTQFVPDNLNLEVPMENEIPSNIWEIDQNNDLPEDHKEEAKVGGGEENKIEIGQEADLEDQGSQKVIDSNSQASFSKPEVQINPREYLNMRPAFYYLITTLLFTFVVITSIVVKDVSIVFGIIGSVVSGFMIFVGPGSYYILQNNIRL